PNQNVLFESEEVVLMNRKLIVASVGVAVAALMLTACGSAEGGETEGEVEGEESFISAEDVGKFADALPEEFQSAGALDLYLQQPNPPMEFADLDTDELLGVSPDIISSLGELFDVDMNIHRV